MTSDWRRSCWGSRQRSAGIRACTDWKQAPGTRRLSGYRIVQKNIRSWSVLRTWEWYKCYGMIRPHLKCGKEAEEIEKTEKMIKEAEEKLKDGGGSAEGVGGEDEAGGGGGEADPREAGSGQVGDPGRRVQGRQIWPRSARIWRSRAGSIQDKVSAAEDRAADVGRSRRKKLRWRRRT